jgi:hypothetical protein
MAGGAVRTGQDLRRGTCITAGIEWCEQRGLAEGRTTSGFSMKATIMLILVSVLLLVGCGEDRNSGETHPVGRDNRREFVAYEQPTRVVVTSDDASLPDGCHPRQVADLLITFVYAFNAGDQAVLSRTFFLSEAPPPPDFADRAYHPWSWYTVGRVEPGGKIAGGFVTYDQRELLRYFAKRHNKGERLRLLKVSLGQTGLMGMDDNVGFAYVLNRTARDLEPDLGGPASIASGQGTINCKNRRIFTWRMEMKAGDDRTSYEAASWLCTSPPGWRPGKAVVACT